MAVGEPNDSERLLFRHHSQPLVRLDCNGQVRPALARAWATDSTRQTWTFTLGSAPPSASDVVSSWRGRDAVDALGIDSAVALDDLHLRVSLRPVLDSAPALFADSELAIPTSGHASGVHLRVASDRDPRDALDRGADVVVTRDPAVVDYVARRPEFTTFHLPWSRVYILLQPAGAVQLWVVGEDSVRRSLAEDVAQADARATELPFWWTGGCPYTEVSYVVPPTLSPRIVYPRDDGVARGLAERIVALSRDSVPLKTAGLSAAEFAIALRGQADRGYVMSFPRPVPALCHELAALPTGSMIHPLIETRAHAIVRKGSPSLTVDWDGVVRGAAP